MTAAPAGPTLAVGSSGINVLLEEVVEWTPNEVMAYEILGLPKALRSVQNRWVLAAHGAVPRSNSPPASNPAHGR